MQTDPSMQLKLENVNYLEALYHEIGTPVTAIVGLSHILSSVECSPEKKSECAQMLRDSSRMLMALLKDLLDTSRLTAGSVEMERSRFSLVHVSQEAMRIIAFRAEEKGLGLNLHIDRDVPRELFGDSLRIQQILLNLLTNAVKFTTSGHISLYVSAANTSDGRCGVTMNVIDSGRGISNTAISRIFERYVQASKRVDRKQEGMGLGLSLSRGFARLMGGDITAQSVPGVGSRFTVTLLLDRVPVAHPKVQFSQLAAHQGDATVCMGLSGAGA